MIKENVYKKIALLMCGAAMATTSVAQDGSSQSGGSFALEEVVVTAQKRAQSANDIGMSITAISGDMLRNLGINDTTALAESVTGLTFSDSGFAVPVYTLRGVGFSENSVQAQSTVGVYNDQVAVPYPIMTKGLLMDMERLEVLKGPQGTLFGRNSTGGAINYIARKPTEEFEASTTIGYGRFDTLDFEGVVSGSLSDTVNARFAGRTIQAGEGWQESVSRDDTHGEQDKVSARALVDIQANDDLNVLLSASWWSDKSDTQTPQLWEYNPSRPQNATVAGVKAQFLTPLAGTDDNQATEWTGGNNLLGSGPKADMSSTSLSATVEWDLNEDLTLTSLTSYSEFENDSQYTNDGNPGIPFDASIDGGVTTILDTINPLTLPLYENAGVSTTDGLVGGVWYTNDSQIDAFSQELRLSGSNDILNWVAGIYYSDDTVESNTPQIGENATSVQRYTPGGVGLTGVNNPTEQEADAWAIFGHSELNLSDALKLTTGLRYTEENKSYTGCTADSGLGDGAAFVNALLGGLVTSGGPAVAGGCMTLTDGAFGPVSAELNEDSVSGKLALDWTVNDDLLTYLSLSRGYKGGSFPTFTSTDGRQLLPVVQERLDAIELGLKATLLDGNMQLNTATFYYDYKDKQLLSKITLPIFGAVNALANAPKAKVYGAELDLKWSITQGLFASLSGTYTNTEATDFIAYNQYGVEGDMSGSSFPLSPETQLSAMLSYEWNAFGDVMAFVTGDVAYSDGSTTDYDIAEVLDSGANGRGYAGLLASLDLEVGDSFDAQESYQIDATTLVGAQLGVRSADDKWSLALWGRNLTDEYRVNNTRRSSDAILAWTGMPRTYGITFNYNWD